MMYTLFARDEHGREITLTEMAVSHITESTVFLCPETASQLTSLHLETVRDAFTAAGIHAIVCNTPMRLYQMKPYKEMPND